jgi:hypothetical protein
LPHQRVERQPLDAQVVVGGDLLRHHEVVAGLRLAGVGDGGGADLEVALGRRQLLAHGLLLRLHEGQRVLRRQHVEVGLADADDQVLRGGGQLRLRQVDLQPALLVGGPVGRPVQRLRGRDGGALGAEGTVGDGRVDVQRGPAGCRRQVGLRQDAGGGLVGAREVGVVLRLGRLPRGVVGARRFVQLLQALG